MKKKGGGMHLEELLRVGGLPAGYLLVVALGITAGVLGYFCKKNIRDIEGDLNLNHLIFFGLLLCFVCSVVIYFFSLPLFLAGGNGKIANILIVCIYSWIFSKYIVNKTRKKISDCFGYIIVSLFVGFVLLIILALSHKDIGLYQFSQKQKAEWWISEKILKIVQTEKEIKTALEKSKKYGYLPASIQGIANLRLGNREEAVKNFIAHSESVENDNHFWLGMAYYYEDCYFLASREFQAAEISDMEIVALFLGKNLNLQKLSELMEKRKNMLPINFLLVIREQLLLQKSVSAMSDSEKLILQKFAQLENVVTEEKNKNDSLVCKIDTEVLNAIVDCQKTLISAPSGGNDFETFLFFVLVLPLFVSTTLITNKITNKIAYNIWRKNQLKKERRWLRWLGKIANKVAEKISWHSFIARNISVKIALFEKEKGMFLDEIIKIRQAVFPFDAFLALFYLRRSRRVVKNWRLSSQEKKDIEYIVKEIRLLIGKLIPRGNQESLAILTALREKAIKKNDKYIKKIISYKKIRIFLLGILNDLAVVGDILEARNNDNQISYYSLFGIESRSNQEEVKKAYRNIIPVIHPDKHNGNHYLESLTAIVTTVYSVLSNPLKREIYDKQMGF